MNTDETPNPIAAAKVISYDTDPVMYHKLKGGARGALDFIMSNSELKRFAKCPHKWLLSEEDAHDTDATRWGTLVDCLALTHERFKDWFAVTPETYPDTKTGAEKPWNWNANHCKAWRDDQGEKVVTRPGAVLEARKAVQRLQQDDQIGVLLAHANFQVMVVGEYHDKDTGLVVPIKGLIDIVPDLGLEFWSKTLADLKTAKDASVRSWPRNVFFWGLHVQAALYLDLYTRATGEDRTDFLHAISESEAPYEPGRALLTCGSQFDFVEEGRRVYVDALRFYCRCLKTGLWPGYADMSENKIHGWPICQPEAWMIGGGPVMPVELEEETNEPNLDNNDIMP